ARRSRPLRARATCRRSARACAPLRGRRAARERRARAPTAAARGATSRRGRTRRRRARARAGEARGAERGRRSLPSASTPSAVVPARSRYCAAAVRWFAVNVNPIAELWPCSALPADDGSVRVARRWSVLPAETDAMFERAIPAPITGREARTVEVVPPHVYVYGGPPASVHAVEQRSISSWRPSAVSSSSCDEVVAFVVSVIEPTLLEPAEPSFVTSIARWMVSPGTRFDAPTVRRSVAPSAIETVPELRFCICAGVELVKLAYVPRPATPAAAARRARLIENFAVRGSRMGRDPFVCRSACRLRAHKRVRVLTRQETRT